MRTYYIVGSTYLIKEDLKANGCKWDSNIKSWITPQIDETKYEKLKSLARAVDAEIIPTEASEEIKAIQKILTKANNSLIV